MHAEALISRSEGSPYGRVSKAQQPFAPNRLRDDAHRPSKMGLPFAKLPCRSTRKGTTWERGVSTHEAIIPADGPRGQHSSRRARPRSPRQHRYGMACQHDVIIRTPSI